MSRGRLAADLGVDKSVVGRWMTGVVKPSGHNLARLTALVARQREGFNALDWDRGLEGLARRLGADPAAVSDAGEPPPPMGIPLALLDQVLANTRLRGSAYEGFFRSTRPAAMAPGRFLHDHGLIRRAPNGLLRLTLRCAGTVVDGWMLPLGNQLFCVAADITSGAMLFGVFNGVATHRADIVDGLILGSALDAARTPTAAAMIFERIRDLSDDEAADAKAFEAMAACDPLAPEGSVPERIIHLLTRDFGPSQLDRGGEWLLQMPLALSMAIGPAFGDFQKFGGGDAPGAAAPISASPVSPLAKPAPENA